MITPSIPAAPTQVNLTVTLRLKIDANGEDPDYLAQRMNSALYQAIHLQGLTRNCPDSQASVASHEFNLQIDPEESNALTPAP